jgi:histidyl-tRNA synthetase
MNDVLTDASPRWQFLEGKMLEVLVRYGYQEIRLPVIEQTGLFERSIGEDTDIVSKEMYTFNDRNGDSLTLRPEGTAGCVRAVLQHSLFHGNPLRLWYMGPMFRRERPQKGRTRQFNQIGVEVFGLEGPDIDAELILMCARMWQELGLEGITLQINSLGTPASRQRYRNILIEYFSDQVDRLDTDSRTRLQRNPLRILDSKNPEMQELIRSAPALDTCLDDESREHFRELQEILQAAAIPFQVNPRLVRGLDYYTKTVFEWITDRLGAQGTICAGGRYDGLVEACGGNPVPASGFAMGLERLVEVLGDSTSAACDPHPHVYFISAGGRTTAAGFALAEQLRERLPALRLVMHCGGGSFKSRFKKADKSGAALALVLGEEELEHQLVGLKYLRQETEQQQVPWESLEGLLKKELRI